MRVRWTILALVVALNGVAAAGSIDPDLNRIVREARKPRMHYGPARVGWNGPEISSVQHTVNPVYESLRMDSPEAVRRELKAAVVPDWPALLVFATLIIVLRMLRSSRDASSNEESPTVVPFPAPPVPRQEAA